MSETLRAPLISQHREPVGEVELPAAIFGAPPRPHLLQEAVRMQLANRRAGSAATKTRAFVRGGGKKPWRQKGTGWARAGSSRSPIWVGGAIVFGPHPRDYSYRMPRAARRSALRSALSARMAEERLVVVDRIDVSEGRTREAVEILDKLGVSSVLVVVLEATDLVVRAFRNLPHAKVLPLEGVNVYDILRYETLILEAACIEPLEGRLGS